MAGKAYSRQTLLADKLDVTVFLKTLMEKITEVKVLQTIYSNVAYKGYDEHLTHLVAAKLGAAKVNIAISTILIRGTNWTKLLKEAAPAMKTQLDSILEAVSESGIKIQHFILAFPDVAMKVCHNLYKMLSFDKWGAEVRGTLPVELAIPGLGGLVAGSKFEGPYRQFMINLCEIFPKEKKKTTEEKLANVDKYILLSTTNWKKSKRLVTLEVTGDEFEIKVTDNEGIIEPGASDAGGF